VIDANFPNDVSGLVVANNSFTNFD